MEKRNHSCNSRLVNLAYMELLHNTYSYSNLIQLSFFKMTNSFILSKIILVGSSFLFGCFLCKFIIIKQNSVSVFYKLLIIIYSFNFIELFVLFTTFYLLVNIVFNIMVFDLYQIIELLIYVGISTVDMSPIGIIDIPESSTINIPESSTGDSSSGNTTTNNSSNSTNNSSNTSTNYTTNTSNASTKTPNAPINNATFAMLMGAANAAGVKVMQYTPKIAGTNANRRW